MTTRYVLWPIWFFCRVIYRKNYILNRTIRTINIDKINTRKHIRDQRLFINTNKW